MNTKTHRSDTGKVLKENKIRPYVHVVRPTPSPPRAVPQAQCPSRAGAFHTQGGRPLFHLHLLHNSFLIFFQQFCNSQFFLLFNRQFSNQRIIITTTQFNHNNVISQNSFEYRFSRVSIQMNTTNINMRSTTI